MKKLLMFDHDGTICQTNSNAYDSIIHAAEESISQLQPPINHTIENWEELFKNTEGTTEANLAHHLFAQLGIPNALQAECATKFYLARARWYESMQSMGEYVWDSYYPDALKLIAAAGQDTNVLLHLVSGNPRSTLEKRMPKEIALHFQNHDFELQGTFGEEARTRKDLILINIEKAKQDNQFSSKHDAKGFLSNAYYIADSENDLYAGLEAKVRVIWIPSRKLQTVVEQKSKREIRLFETFIGNEFIIVNNLDSDDVQRFLA